MNDLDKKKSLHVPKPKLAQKNAQLLVEFLKSLTQ
jgi:hypothetical protein